MAWILCLPELVAVVWTVDVAVAVDPAMTFEVVIVTVVVAV